MEQSDVRPPDGGSQSNEHFEHVIGARLGGRARDLLEATIVLEAWTGKPARAAMSSARHLVDRDLPRPVGKGSIDRPDDREQQSVVAEGITLVLSIVSIAAWATPLTKDFGPHVLAQALRVALPVAFALQWALRSRYLSRRTGLACLKRDGIGCVSVLILTVGALGMMSRWGPIAAMFVTIWVSGTITTRRGWGLLYAGMLLVTTVALEQHEAAYLVLALLTAVSLLSALVAIGSGAARGGDQLARERPGSIPRALLAGLLGGCIGVLIVGDPSLGWGVHGLHPAIALVPSVLGSFWGGYYLWNFYEEVPRRLIGVPISEASRAHLRGPATSMLFGAVLRLLVTTVVLSAVVIAAGRFTQGTDDASVFVAFACVALVSLLVSLMESLALRQGAFIAVVAALVSEFAWVYMVHTRVPGAALAVGAAVGVILTVPPLLRLSSSGRVLATMLWIQ
ncbi:MAG: hypothetical protein ACLP8S_00650 [Solirubrobacteraceae bacterium]